MVGAFLRGRARLALRNLRDHLFAGRFGGEIFTGWLGVDFLTGKFGGSLLTGCFGGWTFGVTPSTLK